MKNNSSVSILASPQISLSVLPPRGLGITAAARYAGVTVNFIREHIWSGELHALMLGKRHIVLREELDRFLSAEAQRQASAEQREKGVAA